MVGRPFINNLCWKFNGFDQASHYSTSVSTKTLRNGIAGSLLLVSSTLLIPILVITGATNIEQDEWKAGSIARAGNEIGGRWLGNLIVCSAGVCLLAQFLSDMAAESMMIQGLADQGYIPSIFRHQSPHNTPTVSNIFDHRRFQFCMNGAYSSILLMFRIL
jgi:amino acid transporter